MLNGGYGDFCIKTETDGSRPADYNSHAWSSNTDNFVLINEDSVYIYNWKRSTPELIPKNKVVDNFNKFYKYLVSKSYKSEKDIIPFILGIFRQFRNMTLERTEAAQALNFLFVLLVGIEENTCAIDFNKWGLPEIEIPGNFYNYTEKLLNGISDLKPKLDLIIRHTSGILFQEAQKEILDFDRQIDLWGTCSDKIAFKKRYYSSVHYTPTYLARTIVENSLKELDFSKPILKIFDPACGSSEFLVEALKQLHEKGYAGDVQLHGWDSSSTAFTTSNFLLNYEKRTVWEDKLKFNISLVEDSLTQNWNDDYDLILMNPPFVSWELMDRNSRDAVKEAPVGLYFCRIQAGDNLVIRKMLLVR